MATFRRVARRLLACIRFEHAERELTRELSSHLALLADEFQKQGMTPEDAVRAARRASGGIEQTKEQHRDARSFLWLDDARRDVEHTFRRFAQAPGYSAVVITTLALGIGANAAVFSVVHGVLLKPLGFHDPDRIVSLWGTSTHPGAKGMGIGLVAIPDVEDWRAQATSFDAMAHYIRRQVPLMVHQHSAYGIATTVSDDFLNVFGVQPLVGRGFTPETSTRPEILVSHAFAKAHFGDIAASIGQTVSVRMAPATVVGVLPPGFNFPDGTDIWQTIQRSSSVGGRMPPFLNRRNTSFLAVARLKNGRSVEHVQAEMTSIAAGLAREHPATNQYRAVTVRRLQDQLVGNVRLMLQLLLAAVAVVLFIACANLATLQLARATTRLREIAIRASLGASRARIVRQTFTEGVIQAMIAGAAGLLIAWVGTWMLVALAPADVPRLAEVAVDRVVLLFTVAVAMVSSVLVALVPAVHAWHVDLDAVRQGSSRTTADNGTRRIREMLVVTQLAMAVALLATSTLLVKSLLALQQMPLGFRPENVLVMDASVLTSDPKADATLFFRDLLGEASRLPGVLAAGATMSPPGRIDASGGVAIDHLPPLGSPDRITGVLSIVSPGAFAALGIQLIRGRDFNNGDVLDAPRVAIVNERLGRMSPAGQDPIGRFAFCTFDSEAPMRIVGVVGDVRQSGPAVPPKPECYMPYLQHDYNDNTLRLVVRSAGDPTTLAETLRRKAQQLSPAVPVKFTTLQALTDQNVATPRFRTMLVGAFALMALLLAVIGLFGVMAYNVTQRTREIGLRMALGATARNVMWLLVGRGLRLAATGLVLGLALAIAATVYIRSLLFDVEPTDPMTYVGVTLALGLTALTAMSVPAIRATRIDPQVALRWE